jgi:peptidoglycan biosynthesis protein MviN/MurJ (putative lipid II flippase)
LFTIALNVFLAYNWAKPDAYGVVGLALAQSTVAAVEVIILLIIMTIRDRKIFSANFFSFLTKAVSATGFSAITAYFVIQFLPLTQADRGSVIIVKLSFIALIVFSVHTLVSYVLGLNEAKIITNRLKRLIIRPVKVS